MLAEKGMRIPDLTKADERTIAAVVNAYAHDPEATSRISTNTRIGTMTPAALRAIDMSLKAFGENVVESSTQLRHYVTNKLIEESDNPDPRIRVRALELLGKISDVGLFADKTEVTITHQTTGDLKDALRAKLQRLVGPDTIDAEIIEDTDVDVPEMGAPRPALPRKARKAEPVPVVDLDAAMDGWDD